jgi:hypothetical protein
MFNYGGVYRNYPYVQLAQRLPITPPAAAAPPAALYNPPNMLAAYLRTRYWMGQRLPPSIIPAANVLSVASGTYTLTGFATTLTWLQSSRFQQPNLLAAYLRLPFAGQQQRTYVLSPAAQNLVLNVASGAYALTGYATQLLLARLLQVAGGIYLLTGNAASLIQSSPQAVTMTAGTGLFSLLPPQITFEIGTTGGGTGGGLRRKKKGILNVRQAKQFEDSLDELDRVTGNKSAMQGFLDRWKKK